LCLTNSVIPGNASPEIIPPPPIHAAFISGMARLFLSVNFRYKAPAQLLLNLFLNFGIVNTYKTEVCDETPVDSDLCFAIDYPFDILRLTAGSLDRHTY
jgi:hypothetical protein